MHASLHQVKKITLREVEPLRHNGAAAGPVLGHLRYIVIEYGDNQELEMVCFADHLTDLNLHGETK